MCRYYRSILAFNRIEAGRRLRCEKNHNRTFLAVFILMLPKLTDLRCGTLRLNSLSMSQALYSHVDANDYLVRSERSFFKKQYIGDALGKLALFLQTLELSCHWRGRQAYLSLPPVESLLRFISPEHFSLPIDAAPLYIITFTSDPHSWIYG